MAEQIKEILQLRGINIRNEAADVEDPEARNLLNFDPFQKPGALVIRRGRSQIDLTASLHAAGSRRLRVLAHPGLPLRPRSGRDRRA